MAVVKSPECVVGSEHTSVKGPLLVMLAAPLLGHTAPMLHVAREMIARGFEIIFISSGDFKEAVERIGAHWFEQPPWLDAHGTIERKKQPIGVSRFLWTWQNVWLAQLSVRHQRLKSLLEMVREEDADRRIVIVSETLSLGTLPFVLGASLPRGYNRFPKVICLNFMPLLVSSIDTAPFGAGLEPNYTPIGRRYNNFLSRLMYGPTYGLPWALITKMCHECLIEIGCTGVPKDKFFMDLFLSSYDTTFQMSPPSLEYPRSDLNPSIRYAGSLPPRGIDSGTIYPEWWSQIVENAAMDQDNPQKKKIVVVTQGTVSVEYAELIVPTLEGLAPRSDTIIIVILGLQGATLPRGITIPANARLVDILPYDAALMYADVFITNGGYGGVLHIQTRMLTQALLWRHHESVLSP
ncbi:hypothetical protein GE09DRAFT_980258 [Coniochaeta sp. 2T2.1]|nr:hypothetical protein GE09DRAFT_980258 [Coniochaeta sp. 2T2.1]